MGCPCIDVISDLKYSLSSLLCLSRSSVVLELDDPENLGCSLIVVAKDQSGNWKCSCASQRWQTLHVMIQVLMLITMTCLSRYIFSVPAKRTRILLYISSIGPGIRHFLIFESIKISRPWNRAGTILMKKWNIYGPTCRWRLLSRTNIYRRRKRYTCHAQIKAKLCDANGKPKPKPTCIVSWNYASSFSSLRSAWCSKTRRHLDSYPPNLRRIRQHLERQVLAQRLLNPIKRRKRRNPRPRYHHHPSIVYDKFQYRIYILSHDDTIPSTIL